MGRSRRTIRGRTPLPANTRPSIFMRGGTEEARGQATGLSLGSRFTRGGSTMKAAFTTLLGLAIVLAVTVAVQAGDKKAVTLKGDLTCGKCQLDLDKKITKGKCVNTITVKKDDKETVYILDDKGGKEK